MCALRSPVSRRPRKRRTKLAKPQSNTSRKPETEATQLAAAGCVLSVGEIVLTLPDEAGRKRDVANGYTLGVCIGRIISVNATACTATIQYYWGKSWRGVWREWRGKDNSPYTEEVLPASLLTQRNMDAAPIARMSWKAGSRGSLKLAAASVKEVSAIAAYLTSVE